MYWQGKCRDGFWFIVCGIGMSWYIVMWEQHGAAGVFDQSIDNWWIGIEALGIHLLPKREKGNFGEVYSNNLFVRIWDMALLLSGMLLHTLSHQRFFIRIATWNYSGYDLHNIMQVEREDKSFGRSLHGQDLRGENSNSIPLYTWKPVWPTVSTTRVSLRLIKSFVLG